MVWASVASVLLAARPLPLRANRRLMERQQARPASPALPRKWRNLTLLAAAELLAMALWFSASAVVPQLTAEWRLTEAQKAWMTMSVQIGFVAGALLSAVLNLADRVPIRRLFAISALVGAAANA